MLNKNIVNAVIKSVVVLGLALLCVLAVQSNNTQQVEAASSDNYKTVYENINGGAGLFKNPFIRLNQNRPSKVVKARHFKISMRIVADNGMVWYRTTSKLWIPSDFTNRPKSISHSQLKKNATKKFGWLTIGNTTYILRKATIKHQTYYYAVKRVGQLIKSSSQNCFLFCPFYEIFDYVYFAIYSKQYIICARYKNE